MENREANSKLSALGNILSDQICRQILSHLMRKPDYVKGISRALGMEDSRISERLRRLRNLGLVDFRWIRNAGKNVKEYFLVARNVKISIESGEPTVEIEGKKRIGLQFEPSFDFSFPKVETFVGRRKEMEMIQSSHAIIVTGIPGIGKTALVSEWARRSRTPVLWHNVREVDTLDYILLKFATFLERSGFKQSSEAMKLGLERRFISDLVIYELKRSGITVVFDDFHFCMDENILTFVKDISISKPEVRIIVISRRDENISGSFRVLQVGGLSLEDSLRLLRLRGKIHDVHTLSLLSGYPPALTSFKSAKDFDKRASAALRQVGDAITGSLTEGERSTLRIALAFREDFSEEEISYVSGRNVSRELENLSFKRVIYRKGDRFAVYELARKGLKDLARNSKEIHSRLAALYLSDRGLKSKMEVIFHLAYAQEYERLVNAIKTYAPKLLDAGLIDPLLSILKEIGPELMDQKSRGWVTLWTAKLEQISGNYSDSLVLFEEAGNIGSALDRELLARSLLGRGQTLDLMGKAEESLAALQEARIAAEGSGNDELEANILMSLDGPLSQLGRIEESLEVLSSAMKIYEAIGQKRNYFTCMSYRGWKYFLKGDFKAAISDVTKAYEGLFEMNALLSSASCLLQKSIILWKENRLSAAYSCASRAIEMFRDQSDHIGELAEAHSYRALISASKGDIERAGVDIRMCKTLMEKNSPQDVMDVINLTEGLILEKSGEREKAISRWMKSERPFVANPLIMFEIKEKIATALMNSGEIGKGVQLLKELGQTCSEHGLGLCVNEVARKLEIVGSLKLSTVYRQN